jgi:hypothetical protein
MSTTRSSSGSAASPTSAGNTGSCEGLADFTLPTDNPNPTGTTPRQALDLFLAHGSVHGSAPPKLTPAQAGFPRSGWRLVEIRAGKATFTSQGDELDFTRNGNGTWIITGGSRNC